MSVQGSEGVLAPVVTRGAGAGGVVGRDTDVLRGDRAGGVGVRTRLRDEDRLAVVAQFGDGLADVGEGAVVAVLLRAVEVGPGVPAAGQLLDRGDVHDPVVQVVLQGRHVAGQEAAVGADGVAAQRGLAPAPARARGRSRGPAASASASVVPVGELVEQPGGGVHLAHHLGHGDQRRGRRADHDVHAVAEHVQLGVGDQGGHLDQRVVATARARSSRSRSTPCDRSCAHPTARSRCPGIAVLRPVPWPEPGPRSLAVPVRSMVSRKICSCNLK